MNSFVSFNNLEAGTWFLMVDSPYKSVRFNITLTASTSDDDDDEDPVDGDSEGSPANPVPLTLGKYRLGTVGVSAPSYYSLAVPLDGVSYYIRLYEISPIPASDSDVYIDVSYTEAVSGDYEEQALLRFPEDNTHQVFYFSKAGTLDIRMNSPRTVPQATFNASTGSGSSRRVAWLVFTTSRNTAIYRMNTSAV